MNPKKMNPGRMNEESLYDEMGDPAVDAERHRRISPLFHTENIIKPILVVQGANDPRVLQVESDELVAGIQANEIPVEYLVFPDEGHGFRKRENRISASDAYVKFLDIYLKGEKQAVPHILSLAPLKMVLLPAALSTASISCSFFTGFTRYSTTPSFIKSTASFRSG